MRSCYREHGEIFWSALDQLQLTEDADLLAPIANALRGRVGTTREYVNIEPPVIAVSVEKGVETAHRSPRVFPRSFEWKGHLSIALTPEQAELLKKGLVALKTAKKHDARGAATDESLLTGCDAAAYVECLAMVQDWIRGAEVRGVGTETPSNRLPAPSNGQEA